MSNKIQPVRGTKDLLADQYRQFKYIVDSAREISSRFGFDEIATPIFEFTKIFARTLGQDSDVVGKEMYSFLDRSENNISLRPEFTAGIARAFISNGLTQSLPLKLFSYGPLFRYERPQKGRQRQFHQINFEYLGNANPQADVEVISMGDMLIEHFDLQDKIQLEINSIGCTLSREKYIEALKEYLSDFASELSEDSKRRLQTNPLRILDSKDENDKKIIEDAPIISDYYTSEATDFFSSVKEGLNEININYIVNDKLVRGLDYYNHTAFEFTTKHLGSQNAVLAGGRYDYLIKIMGGVDTPAVGFAGGVERLMQLYDTPIDKKGPIAIIPIGDLAIGEVNKLSYFLRSSGFYIESYISGNVGKRMKKASKANAVASIVFGDDEIKNKIVNLKDFTSGQEEQVSMDLLIDKISKYK